jgi:hypothetical protein
MAFRPHLGDMKKHDQPAYIYFNMIKTLADVLLSIGEPLRDSESVVELWGDQQALATPMGV